MNTLESRIETAYYNRENLNGTALQAIEKINESIFSAWGNLTDKSEFESFEDFEAQMLENADYEEDGFDLDILEELF